MKFLFYLFSFFLFLSTPLLSDAAETPDARCTTKGVRGPCKALLDRHYYDPGSGTCKEFFWGGCGEPAPFETKEECLKVCGDKQPLVITELKAFPEKRLPYALLHLEYPKDWPKPQFTVLVNENETPSRWWGGGYSRDRQYATLIFFPGEADSVKITVQASVSGKTYEAKDTLWWNVWAMAGLLDGPGRLEAVMKPRALRFWAFPVETVRVLFNGQYVTPKLDSLSAKPLGLFTIDSAWQAGKNTLSIETTGKDGKKVVNDYSFVYLRDGTIGVGETMVLSFSTAGSGKSGPFYSVVLEGNALASVGEGEESYYVIESKGWALRETSRAVTLKAERPGETRVKIIVKRHFLLDKELEQEFSVNVIPVNR